MNPQIAEIKKRLEASPSLFGSDDLDNLLELIWSVYVCFIPVEPDTLPLRDQSGKKSFCDGVRIGAQLMLEIME